MYRFNNEVRPSLLTVTDLGTGCLLARMAQLPIGPGADGGGKQRAGGNAVVPPVFCPSWTNLVNSCTQTQEASRPHRKS